MIKGRPWCCPGCGGSECEQLTVETRKSPHKLQDRIIAALRARKMKGITPSWHGQTVIWHVGVAGLKDNFVQLAMMHHSSPAGDTLPIDS